MEKQPITPEELAVGTWYFAKAVGLIVTLTSVAYASDALWNWLSLHV